MSVSESSFQLFKSQRAELVPSLGELEPLDPGGVRKTEAHSQDSGVCLVRPTLGMDSWELTRPTSGVVKVPNESVLLLLVVCL